MFHSTKNASGCYDRMAEQVQVLGELYLVTNELDTDFPATTRTANLSVPHSTLKLFVETPL